MLDAIPWVREQLMHDTCRKIVVPSLGAANEVARYFDFKGILEKVEVVRPARNNENGEIKKTESPFTMLCIGNRFWGKGIPFALEVFKILRSRYGKDVQLVLVCGDVPADVNVPDGVILIDSPMLTKDHRTRLFDQAHVFLSPCVQDVFVAYLDAMAFGVPIIGTSIYDKSELVLHGDTGFLVNTPLSLFDGPLGIEWKTWDHFQSIIKKKYEEGAFLSMIEEMVFFVEKLMHDRPLLDRMGVASQKLQREKFSISSRNSRILDVYEKALYLGSDSIKGV
jgi:glycosyltransferase involved in cell wall biosynthesis